MDAKKIGLLGGRGYVGQEILDLISNHEYLNISSIFSFSKAGQQVDPNTQSSLLYQDLSLDKIILSDEDAFILALPNNQSQDYIDLISQHNPKAIIIDLSSDNRFNEKWQYRVPELSEKVKSKNISNPGCYASAMQFMLAPLQEILVGPVNFYGISGYSGAGATPNSRNDKETLKDSVIPYSLVAHLHEKEVKAHSYPEVLFTPHVGNFFRGIMMTGNFILSSPMLPDEIYSLFVEYYNSQELICIQTELPNLQDVQNTSNVIIGGFAVDQGINRLTFCCVLDNLLKGAATQTIQNLNSAFGWEDNLGII